MSYPLDIAVQKFAFSDGNRSNKFYDVYLMVNTHGMAIIVRHWGKKGTSGDLKVEQFAIQKKAESEFEKLCDSRRRKAYELISSNIKQANTDAEVRMAVGPALWPRIPGPDIKHVLPHLDTTGRPQETNPARYNENGKWIGEAPARVYSKTEIAKARQAEREAEQVEAVKTYAANPRFGLF
ncbi:MULTISPECIES: WGR domain-containing protein [unclassified Ensifer]|uniref:WGR domain-containing protein n=1 Tax=unclassified Ensifer TaxID=2633371 RepID=UPI0008139AC2|nr:MULTISPECIES: WGR domain-containing protein [unclassified Ensifer]OCP21875.1 hypothetical protein BC361_25235 [Ensifer sp. LC54]OCP23345.1 hypothetical protein BC363_25530 [Ensifer sp. LC384]